MKSLNLGLRFFLELAMLFAFGFWGFSSFPDPLSRVLGIGAPLAAAIIWGIFIAPKARRRLPDPGRLTVEIVMFALATVALTAAGAYDVALLFCLLSAVSLFFMLRWNQRRLA